MDTTGGDDTGVETTGHLTPATPDAARTAYEELAEPANVVSTEVATAMAVEDLRERLTADVVATARDALFASILEVRVGDRESYERWRADFDGEVIEAGSDQVDTVAWHAFDGTAVAATFQNERGAAVATLRRQAFNRLYRGLFYPDEDDATAGATDGSAGGDGSDGATDGR